jgi:hypothetical protein
LTLCYPACLLVHNPTRPKKAAKTHTNNIFVGAMQIAEIAKISMDLEDDNDKDDFEINRDLKLWNEEA